MTNAVDGVRLGNLMVHQISGVLSNGDVLAMCGRTIDHTDSRFTLVDPLTVPLAKHCLGCW
ncbi:MAG TPA: hypothetical protein VJL80_06340 [Aeromicrobium sp.]|nr:hypothetical protein [Aeromicrobium sp.]HKY57638.1 hypothetical protein [Aeromicrobium sp.]